MENKRILEIQERIKWLKIELVHENYLDGYSIDVYKDELKKLIIELENLQNKKDG